MSRHAATAGAVAGVRRHRASHGSTVIRFMNDRFLWLPLGAAIAFVWANVAGDDYFRVAHALAFPVNEIGMALFLTLIAQGMFEAVMPGGALHTWRKWGLPVIGAAGGIAGAAFAYGAYVRWAHEQVLTVAWPIACAIDVAAGYYVLRMIFRRRSVLAFFVLLAAATDGIVLMVMAGWHPLTTGHLAGALLVLVALGMAAIMRWGGVTNFVAYLGVCGAVSWFGFRAAGVHPALALIPLVPFLPHERRRLEFFADVPDDDAVHHAEHRWNEAVQVVLFLFGLVNAGVTIGGYDTGTWAVMVAALVGRPIGIGAALALAIAAGLRLPRSLGWREAVVMTLATTSGFTLALFLAGGLLPPGAVLQQIKIGALATAAGALAAVAVARMLRAGRFA